MADEQNDPASPTNWLWREIERRFGKEATDDLHQAHNEQLKLYARRQALDNYRRQLPWLERQLQQAKNEGKSTGALEKRIALRRERLKEAGEMIP
jgi:hypothetical protein